jgi:peptidoglycan/xylan/chitin deacetylase (PgdA/CDA1 family)
MPSQRRTRGLLLGLGALSALVLTGEVWLPWLLRDPQPGTDRSGSMTEKPSLDQLPALPWRADAVRRFRFPDQRYRAAYHRPDWQVLGASEFSQDTLPTVFGFLKHRMLHFTFDDGPSLDSTARILDALSEYNLRATFFVVGRHLFGPDAKAHRDLLKRMDRDGHTVAVHSYSHRDLRALSDQQIHRELYRTETMMNATLGYRPGLFRPPYGGRSQRTRTLLRTRGYTEILWNIAPEEYGARTPWEILSNFHAALNDQEGHAYGPGGIVLLHDNRAETADAVPLIMEELRRRNCALLGQSGEELWDVVGDLSYYLFYPDGFPEALVARRQAQAREAALSYCNEYRPEQRTIQAEKRLEPRAG